jgi:cation diffusion facilitator CzcD-associated flavoprotein CzcO
LAAIINRLASAIVMCIGAAVQAMSPKLRRGEERGMSSGENISSSRVAIIGSGFGGIGMAYHLKQAGIDAFTIFEKSDEIGGVWRDNTYPGAGCDVPSQLYSFSFESHHPWAWRYGKQAEILDYLRHCVRKFGIASHIQFRREVVQADFNTQRGIWRLKFADGGVHEAEMLISAVGQLHRPALPKIEGQQRFAGTQFHSARWDHGFDPRGKTVAVIGSGASAVQFVPEIARQVRQLYLFQRSPGWVAPKFERPISPFMRRLFDRLPWVYDLDRLRIFLITEALAYAYNGHAWAERLMRLLAQVQLRIQVRDPALRRKLTPDFPIGCKRILLTTQWLPALIRPNVEVVGEAIAEITETAVRNTDGCIREVDAIIYATGFAATEFLAPMRITGIDGRLLSEHWRNGADAYLGMAVAGFPNFFLLYGPNTNVGSGSIVFMLECQQRYIVKLLRERAALGWHCAEVTAAAQADYRREIEQRSSLTTFAGDCQSWYKTADGRNTNNWIGSMMEYRRRTRRIDWTHYRLFRNQTATLTGQP